jgi:hypothetical protein
MKKILIIGIGKGYEHQLEWVYEALPTEELKEMFINKQFDLYDMTSYPEKGDAIDALIENYKDIAAVVAVHLYGIYCPRDISTKHDYFYNAKNYLLLELTKEIGIPFIVFGDQPDGNYAFSMVYNI